MPSTIPCNNSRRLMLVLHFFLVLGLSMTNSNASAQSNKSIALPIALPTKKTTSNKATSAISNKSTKTSLSSAGPSKLQCQNKAKEASKIVFDDCMISVKELEADNIRKEYKAKVVKLKAQYEQKLKKVLSQLKKQSKNGVVPATNEATTIPSNSTLPPKVQNDTPVSEDSSSAAFTPPTPINTQDFLPIDESNSMATTQNSTITTKKSASPEFIDEPTVQLKPMPQSSVDEPSIEQAPTNDNPASSYFPSDQLEGEPASAI